jgi:secreted trypsin-like serine protease
VHGVSISPFRGNHTKIAGLAPVALAAFALLVSPAGAAIRANRPARIVGGSPSAVATAPWTAFLVAHSRSGPSGQFCGGTVASPTAIVTAAHCVFGTRPGQFDVVTGRSALSGSDGQRLGVSRIEVDPGYSPETTGHDAAVVHLAAPTTAPPLALATPAEAALAGQGARLLLTGWGLVTNNDSTTPDELQQATITVAGNRKCKADYGAAFAGVNMICTAGGRPDACRGDSGGPLVSLDGPAPTLVGIVSFGGRTCANPRFPGVYTRVSDEAAFLAGAVSETPPAGTTPPTGGGGSYGEVHTLLRHRAGG